MAKIILFITTLLVACMFEICIESATLRPELETTTMIIDAENTNDLTDTQHQQNLIIDRLKKSMKFNETSVGSCGTAPCGWCPYDEKLHVTLDFIPNTCECREHQKCLRKRPIYSGAYYVYYCSDKISDDDNYDSCTSDWR